MIEAQNCSKAFGTIKALQNVSAEIREGSIFGLIGSNGAGKSTLLRIMAGIYKPDGGQLMVDGENIYENISKKQQLFYISDDQYYFANSNMRDMAGYYQTIYRNFDVKRFYELANMFNLDPRRNLNTFSKGMQKQAFIILGLAAQPKYLLCDETFDGLDPVMRQAVKKLFAQAVAEGTLTPIIASHNLRELEDICDHVGLIHKGGIVFERDIDDLVHGIHKIQCVFPGNTEREDLTELDLITFEKRGSLITMIARGERDAVFAQVNARQPLFAEILPLSLEEIFICEMEGMGYDVDKIIV